MNLGVSLRAPLERRYGPDGYAAIRNALDRYTASVADGAVIAMLDDEDEARQFGFVTAAATPPSIVAAVRQLREQLPAVTSLLLIGGDTLVPVWQLDNPVTDRRADPDRVVLSDNPYGTTADSLEEYVAPALPVGRLIEPPGRSASDVVAMIDATAGHHQRFTRRPGSAAIFNREWEEPAREVMNLLMPTVDEHQTPGYQIDAGNIDDLHRGFVYFNLHGFPDDTAWKAFDPVRGAFATVLTPAALTTLEMSGAIVFAENCYATLVPDGRATCATEMLRRGAGAFVGPTGLSFGSHIRPDLLLDNSDFLARNFIGRVVSGTRTGDALAAARHDYVTDASVSPFNPFKLKTLLQYRLLGDPSLN